MKAEIALRPRQRITVDRAVAALGARRNTVVVAPTGYGKTVVASGILSQFMDGSDRALVLQHRQELLRQNLQKFALMNPTIAPSVVDASEKDFSGQVIFASIDTVRRPNWLAKLPPIDIVMIDEVHHCRSASYMRVLRQVGAIATDDGRRTCAVFGVTATPERTDRKQLGVVFDNCADHVGYSELIAQGSLVPPRTFTPNRDPAIRQALRAVRKRAGEYDENEVARILNVADINAAVVQHWSELAGNRKTIVFCSTVAHARAVASVFRENGIEAAAIDGTTPKIERDRTLRALTHGDLQIVVNVNVLTEGFDAPLVSCIVILRLTGSRSPMLQMIGRGLRTLDAREYPNVIKEDCLVFDWGTSTEAHGALEKSVEIISRDPKPGEAPLKSCACCSFENPVAATACLSCGADFPVAEDELQLTLEDLITLSESDVTENSPFRWENLDDRCVVASGIKAAATLAEQGGHWHSFAIENGAEVTRIMTGRKAIALAAADTYLQSAGEPAARKDRKWLDAPMTEKQVGLVGASRDQKLILRCKDANRYRASCAITIHMARNALVKAYKEAARLAAAD